MMRINYWNIILVYVFSIAITQITSTNVAMAEAAPSSSAPAAVYIIYTEQPTEGSDHEAHHLRTLSSVVGSEEAAKESLIYVYKSAATGFSAKLTPEQVSEIEKQPGVLQVVASKTVQLHTAGGGAANNMVV